jgi:hypothetical protein
MTTCWADSGQPSHSNPCLAAHAIEPRLLIHDAVQYFFNPIEAEEPAQARLASHKVRSRLPAAIVASRVRIIRLTTLYWPILQICSRSRIPLRFAGTTRKKLFSLRYNSVDQHRGTARDARGIKTFRPFSG